MIKKATRVKQVEYVVVDGSLKCLHALREMLPVSGVEVNDGDITRGEKKEGELKGKFISCTKYEIGSSSVPVGSIVFKLATTGDEYDWFCVPEGEFFKKYKEVKKS